MKKLGVEKMKEIIEQSEEVTAIATVAGMDVMTFQDAQKANRAELAFGKEEDLGERRTVAGGLSYASSNAKRLAIDPDMYFINRYKRVEETNEKGEKTVKYYVVTDYRAIQEQASGAIYTPNVVAYVVERNNSRHLVVTGQELISEREFVNDFGKKLKNEDMARIAKAMGTIAKALESDALAF